MGNSSNTILSCQGVQQGCPLAPLLFATVLQKLVNEIKTTAPQLLLNLWYLDDGHPAVDARDVRLVLDILQEKGSELGLHLYLSKCVLFGNGGDYFPKSIHRVSEGLIVLGAPVGTSLFVQLNTQAIVNKIALSLKRAHDLEDPQMELLLLRCCLGTPKLNYWMRTCPSDYITQQIAIFDRTVDETLQHIIGTPISFVNRDIVGLPLSMGGLGISRATDIADIAFVSSMGSSWAIQPQLGVRHGYEQARAFMESLGISVAPLPEKSTSLVSPLINQTKEFKQSAFLVAASTSCRNAF